MVVFRMHRTFFVFLNYTIQGGSKVDVLLIAFSHLWLKFCKGIDKCWIVPLRKLFYFHHWFYISCNSGNAVCGEIAAISRYCLTLLLLMAFSKNKILFHHIDLFYKLRYLFGAFKMIWPMAPNLGFCPRSGFSMPFWVFLLKISRFYNLTA